MTTNISWIAADWGTTHLRVWAIGDDGSVLGQAGSDKGMGALDPGGFEPALLELVGDWLAEDHQTSVIACGMVGARQGWIEAAYLAVPTPPLVPGKFQTAPTRDPRLQVFIIPGLQQDEPADVMRGEETQIAGLMTKRPGFEGVVCMPGTHTKWVRIEGGKVTGFKSCMTGELFSLLEKQSVLRHSLGSDGLDLALFRSAVTAAIRDDTAGITGLFSIRAEDLLKGTPPDALRARLSAGLIADEIRSMRPFWQEGTTILLGTEELVELYQIALFAAGGNPDFVDGTAVTLGGLRAAHTELEKARTI